MQLTPAVNPSRGAAASARARLRLERALGVLALITLAAAWWLGQALNNSGIERHLDAAWPGANHFERIGPGVYGVYADAGAGELLGYVGTGTASGYGGPLTVAVGVDLQGGVQSVVVVAQRETPAWFRKVEASGLLDSLIGKAYDDPFRIGQDVDGISGATYTVRAIVESVKVGVRAAAVEQLSMPAPEEAPVPIVFGIPHITLLLLFAAGYVGHRAGFKYKRQVRWASMLVGLAVLGFIYNAPLTLSHINRLLLGFWPPWQSDLYWYLLIGGILFVFTADNKNPYCEWFCPFGAAQECVGLLGRARSRGRGGHMTLLVWLRRGLVWFAILLALLFRSPGISSYEVFGTLFSLLGSRLQFILLGMVLAASLFVRRPWCAYLCPIAPIDEFIRMVRAWILELWKRNRVGQRRGMAI